MLRPPSLPHARARLTVGLVVALLALGAAVQPLAAPAANAATDSRSASLTTLRAADQHQPLVPRIRAITPDYVPDHGPIEVRGTVTNLSHRTWTDINVHGFMGSTPITTSAELAAAADVPVQMDVGHRITQDGTFASIPSLAPGQTRSFRIRLPHDTLPVTDPGVYWFGVHVLADDGSGVRETVGRDRTFLAYVPDSVLARRTPEDTALVVPVRSGVVRGPDGTVVDPETWGGSLRSGPLADAVATGEAAGSHALTYLLDPAVTDVVRRLAHGNPARTISAPPAHHKPNTSPSASPSGATSATGSASAGGSGATGTAPSTATQRVAASWLHRARRLVTAPTAEVLGLPYGDLAVEPAATYDRELLRDAYRYTARRLGVWGISGTPTSAPPRGRTTEGAVVALPRSATVLLDDTGVSGTSHTVDRVGGHRVVLASAATTEGGPGPVDPRSPLAMRQRILAESAIRMLGDSEPLVVKLPEALQRRIRPAFFSGLDVPFMRLTTLGGATVVRPTRLDPDQLRAPAADDPTFGPRLYQSAQEVLDSGDTLQKVLTGNHSLRRRLFEEVTGNASYAAEQQPLLALVRMRAIETWVERQLASIDLAAPESVTLASTSGRFSVLVSNHLDVPVTVRLRAEADPRLRISGSENLLLPPNGTTSVLLNATTHHGGVHNVTLELTTTDGRLLGAQEQFPLRAEQVSGLIWVIIGIGVALLFAAIAVRLTRRILRARSAR